MKHEVTISSFPTTSQFIRPGGLYGSDYSIVCSCGNETTCSYRETAEAIKLDHLLDGVPFGPEADAAFLADEQPPITPISSPEA